MYCFNNNNKTDILIGKNSHNLEVTSKKQWVYGVEGRTHVSICACVNANTRQLEKEGGRRRGEVTLNRT